ncbi:MAG: RagB/SusD family nutrient uptake outer membrane protein [Chitinophagaceae bacterium]|nr:RagB/SusD family nutrient uptake outer membrane protein [Chitinophagaceae bacterium]
MKFKLVIFTILLSCIAGCKKFLAIDSPANQVTTDKVFLSDATALATLNGILSEMMNSSTQFCAGGTSFYTGLCADELRYYSPGDRDQFFNNAITESVHPYLETNFWNVAYKYIYAANLGIEKLAASTAITPALKDQLTGEAQFIRAFCYFHLLQLFGDVPLVLQSDYRLNEVLPRTPAADIYQQLISDLSSASALLPLQYTNNERVRPTRWAALALLARVYLYTHDWSRAEQTASLVINSGYHSLTATPAAVFLKNSSEAIWQLPPSNVTVNTWEGNQTLPASSSSTPTYLLRPSLLARFETGDLRQTAWVGTRTFQSQLIQYPAKYKVRGNNAPVTEYYMALRLAEQYLVRAEARLEQNKLSECVADLDMIRARAGLAPTTASTSIALAQAVEKERQLELMAEWGHRWFDLKRTNRADAVLGPLKGNNWQPTDVLWPLPVLQLQVNPFLVQNPGY